MFFEELEKTLNALVDGGIEFRTPESRPAPDFPAGCAFPHPYYPPEAHWNHVEIIRPMYGSLALYVNGVWTRPEPNRVQVFLRGAEHTEHRLDKETPYALFWLTVAPDGLNLHQTAYAAKSGYSQSSQRLHTTSPVAEELWHCASADTVEHGRFLSLLLAEISHALSHGDFSTANYHSDVVSQVRKYIEEFYWTPLTLAALGAMTHYAPAYLNAIFRSRTGEPIHACLAQIRMRNAARMLRESAHPVGRIARAVGIADPLYFSRTFRRHFALAPTEYREKYRNNTLQSK